MRHFTRILLLLLLCVPTVVFAQQEVIDQLRKQFNESTNDTVKLNTAKQLFAQYIYSKVDSAIYFASEVVTRGEGLQSTKDVLTGNNYLGIAYTVKGDFVTAAAYMKETLRLHTEAGDSLNMAYSYNNLGLNYTYAGDYLGAAENLIASARIKEALIRSGTSAEDVDLASTVMNIGIAYQNQSDTAQAVTYFNQAIEEADKVGNTIIGAQSKAGLGNILIEKEQYAEAIAQLSEAEVVLSEANDAFSLGKLYNNMARAYGGLDDGENVTQFATKAIEMNRAIGNAHSEALSQAYLGLGHLKMRRYTAAIRASRLALAYGDETSANDVRLEALKNLSDAYAALGNYRQAYEFSVRYKEVDGQVFAEERSEQIERLSAKYEADKREIEIDNLNKETELQALQISKADSEKRLLFVLIGSLVIILLLIAWFYKRILESRKILQAKNVELDKLNSTKDRFFAIISHDIRSYINAFRGNGKLLKYLMAKNETQKMEQVSAEIDKNAQNLSELLDNLLHWSMDQLQGYEPRPETIALAGVVDELFESYQPLAETKGLELRSEVEGDVTVQVDRNGLSVILRNLVANAIKFTEKGSVLISSMQHGNEQVIVVKDTGLGIPASMKEKLFAIGEEKIRRGTSNEKGTGLGLNLVHEFTLANKGRLELETEEGQGSTFLIYLPNV